MGDSVNRPSGLVLLCVVLKRLPIVASEGCCGVNSAWQIKTSHVSWTVMTPLLVRVCIVIGSANTYTRINHAAM